MQKFLGTVSKMRTYLAISTDEKVGRDSFSFQGSEIEKETRQTGNDTFVFFKLSRKKLEQHVKLIKTYEMEFLRVGELFVLSRILTREEKRGRMSLYRFS